MTKCGAHRSKVLRDAAAQVYEGRLPPPKGGNLEDWEDREQTLFRSTAFGDDVDRPLRSRTAAIPISPPTSPTTAPSSTAASAT